MLRQQWSDGSEYFPNLEPKNEKLCVLCLTQKKRHSYTFSDFVGPSTVNGFGILVYGPFLGSETVSLSTSLHENAWFHSRVARMRDFSPNKPRRHDVSELPRGIFCRQRLIRARILRRSESKSRKA